MSGDGERKVVKTDDEWRAQLTAEQYRVTRQAGTERAFTGEYWDTKTAGTYACICCGTEIFRSDAKFDSGCGWPSFFEPLVGARISEHADHSLGMRRVEVRCASGILFTINGELRTLGIPLQPVTFTSTAASPAPESRSVFALCARRACAICSSP